jgi:class 3 adenylate cyclase/tetratricopeptide (TPR) repeat protein
MKPDRFLATVLFTDIVGSTERAAELGDRRWRELLNAHHALSRREIERHGGRELNMTGDGFLTTFDAPERALRCACAVRDALRRIGLEIRSGLHTGEVEVMGKTVGGIGVHIGARVAAQAAPGEILASSTVRDLAAGSGFDFEERGTHALKGVPGEWKLYAVAGEPVHLPVADFWTRAREARLPRVLLLYLLAGAGVLWLTSLISERFQLPGWMLPGAIVLLLIGLVVLSATAWVQSHPLTSGRAAREEVPDSWELDLKELGQSVGRGRLPHLTWSRSIFGGAVAFSLLFGLAGLYVIIQNRGHAFSPREAVAGAAAPGLAVLPFDVRGEGLDVWREGMVDLLSTNLDGAAGLRTIDSRTVLARWDELVQGTRRPDLDTALEVARRTGARYAVSGSAVAIGPDVRLGAEIYELDSGSRLSQRQVEGSPDSVLALVDRLSVEILRAIGGEQAQLPSGNLARATTSSLPALKAYLQGEILFRRSDFESAIPFYEQAFEADSTFALAAIRVATAYGWTESILSQRARQYGEDAARLADRLPEREAMLMRAGMALERGTLDGLAILREAVRRYPDDAEAWNLLGETVWHLGEQALVSREESDQAFGQAVKLDPRFSPAYIHLIDNAFGMHADSAGVGRLIDKYRKITSENAYGVRGEVAMNLAFGSSLGLDEARRSLQGAPSRGLVALLLHALSHPRFLAAQEIVIQELIDRKDPSIEAPLPAFLFHNRISRGKLASAMQLAEQRILNRDLQSTALYFAELGNLPVARELMDRALAPGPLDSLPALRDFYVGAYAADQGRWDAHSEAVDRLRRGAPNLLASGDSTGARYFDALSRGLEGYGLWKKSRSPEGERMLVEAQRQATGHGRALPVNRAMRWWLGSIFAESGRPREAEPYFRSLWYDPLALAPLAQVYEELGEYEKARAAYELFASAWKDADPELQPRAEEARAAARRLTSVIRE